ncbi:MAG TPA: DinB family protein [Gemmatimonadaceae bacterium]|nr:DinB family protein [Gemmatimonadaceae bacterium]
MTQPGQTTVPDSASLAPARSAKERFAEVYEREHATTMKVLRAFPPEQAELRPSERSSSARRLAWTFVMEERMMLMAIRGEPVLGGGYPAPPESWEAILDDFATQHEQIMAELRSPSSSELQGTVRFFTAPKQMGDYRTMEFLWYMLHDQIHHRGQLSVYVRIAGAKLPSIYGPSADEPWT